MPEIEINGIKTFYQIQGDGEPLVFVHGAWVTHRVWDKQVDYFRGNYRVLTYDLRAHGQSGGVADENYTVELLADDLNELLSILSIERPVICGISLGGLVTQVYSIKYLDNIKAQILVDTQVSSAHTLSYILLKYILLPKHSLFLMIRAMGLERYVDFVFELAHSSNHENWLGVNRDTREYLKQEILKYKMREEEFINILDAIYKFDLPHPAVIEVPTLVVNGEYESPFVFKHLEEVKSRLRDFSTVVIPHAGHNSNLENPVEFNKTLEEFLDSDSFNGSFS